MNKVDAAQRRADFEVIDGIERLLRSYGPAEEAVLYGRRGTRNYACAFAFPPKAKVPHILPDPSARNNSTIITKTFDVDWIVEPDTGLVRVRVVAFGFGEKRLAAVEQKIRSRLLRSAIQRVNWGTATLP